MISVTAKWRTRIFTRWASFFSSKKTFSGSIIFPHLTQRSSLEILWLRRIRQSLNLMSFAGGSTWRPVTMCSDNIAYTTSSQKQLIKRAINFAFYLYKKFHLNFWLVEVCWNHVDGFRLINHSSYTISLITIKNAIISS